MLGARQLVKETSSNHRMAADFCRIFEKDMNRLYLLSFLLTADHHMAEECFVRGLDDAINSNRVFKDWAHAWARRMIIQSAIHMIQPQAIDEAAEPSVDARIAEMTGVPARIAAVVGLPAFDRFAFVMSVLERYSDQECAVLLDHSRGEVAAARGRAMQHIAASVELQRQLSLASDERARRSVLGRGSALQLAASA